MADFYRDSFTDALGNAWRVDIYEGTPSARGTTATALNDDVIGEYKDFTWEYDKLPLGLHSQTKCTVMMNAVTMPSELRSWIFNPQTTAAAFALSPTILPAITSGGNPYYRTFFHFQCQPSGQSGYKTVWYGIIDRAEIRPDKDGMVSIPLTDALMYAMEQLPFSALEELDSEWIKYNMADVVASQAVYDYYWNASGWKKVAHYINIAVSNNRIWAVPWINLFIYWETYVNTMYCKVLRLTVTDRVGIRDVLYQNVREVARQKTDNTAGALSVLNITDVYATPLIMDGETSGAEIMDSIYREAERNYKTFLDLYVDLVKSVYRQACVRYYMDGTTDKVEVYHQAPLSDGYTASTVDVTESGHDDLEIAFSTAAIGTAIASNEFAKGADYDKVDQNGLSGRNKEEFAVPVMLHSSPVIPSESYRYDDANKTESDRDSPRYWGLWYIDDPESSGTDRIIRAHSYCAFRNDGIAAPSLPATMGYTLTIEQCRGAAIVDQQESGRAVTLAQQVASTFGASVDAATLQFTDFVDTFTSGYTMIPFVPMMCAIGVDVADIHRYSYASGLTYPVTWYPVKCTYSIKEARVAIEAWGTP